MGFRRVAWRRRVDPTLPVTDVNATVETLVGLGHSFNLFGKTAQMFGALPYSWAQVSGKVLEEVRSITAGLSDTHLRLSVLIRGAPAVSARECARLRAAPSSERA